MSPSLFINPSGEAIQRALDSWQWLPIQGRKPVLVTAFGDIFFEGDDGIWFLDTLEGAFQRVCDTREELEVVLSSEGAADRYCLAGFVERAHREGMVLANEQCYDFTLHPVVGGKIEYSNIQPRDFVLAVHIAGQLHEQSRHLPPGARISRFVFKE
jgi:hypothetical protein